MCNKKYLRVTLKPTAKNRKEEVIVNMDVTERDNETIRSVWDNLKREYPPKHFETSLIYPIEPMKEIKKAIRKGYLGVEKKIKN